MNKIVYFLGAGATKAIAPDAPLNLDLVEKALQNFGGSDEAKRLAEFIQNVYHRVDPVIDNQIWNLLDYIIQQGKSPSYQINLEQINSLKNDLMSLVIQEFEKSLQNIDVRPYEKFVDKIKHLNPTIISTNYDIIIDNALLTIAKQCNYGTKMRKVVHPQDFGLTDGFNRPRRTALPNYFNMGRIVLLKLHGSLNWIYCPKCNEVDLTVFSKGAIRTLQGLHCINEYCTSKYESLLITPTMYKDYENRIIKEIWEYAERALIEADEVIFIGYALKEEDYQIRSLLMKAMLARSGKYKKVTVIEREETYKERLEQLELEVKKKYLCLYGEVDFQPIGFQKYVESLT